MEYLSYTETPVQEIQNELLEKKEIRLLVKREDLNHPFVSGNKWWKLKYNLLEARRQNVSTIITFGGAYSNHIYATAAASSELGLKSIGVIRGEETSQNPTLNFAKSCGMDLIFVSRELYRTKNEKSFIEKLKDQFGAFYLIPEGGTNMLALKGCEEFSQTFKTVSFDQLFIPVGTGGTISGLIAGMPHEKTITGVAVLKNGEFLLNEITNSLRNYSETSYENFRVMPEYHHGGYAKVSPSLLSFIREMYTKHDLPLDHVYTGKMFWALFEEIKKEKIPKGSTVLAIHTGGLQGSKAYNA
jgi:1-aminocyclopropane-1-carboxylate deaminase